MCLSWVCLAGTGKRAGCGAAADDLAGANSSHYPLLPYKRRPLAVLLPGPLVREGACCTGVSVHPDAATSDEEEALGRERASVTETAEGRLQKFRLFVWLFQLRLVSRCVKMAAIQKNTLNVPHSRSDYSLKSPQVIYRANNLHFAHLAGCALNDRAKVPQSPPVSSTAGLFWIWAARVVILDFVLRMPTTADHGNYYWLNFSCKHPRTNSQINTITHKDHEFSVRWWGGLQWEQTHTHKHTLKHSEWQLWEKGKAIKLYRWFKLTIILSSNRLVYKLSANC